ncbi:serine O-acetyltransferase EpsC [Paraburkholderia caballeronis]|uniref:serine O-acetyltransferase n=1 Tax=Paraburkholderia caballeronis TaxID=416943 RepID=A0A1H7JKV3_9BURK|nr:serine O-acetyltransferase EpsC [Paraburkholderia caballeronis]PXW27380.1 serine O-acetyltransferase [Paraburkholderia caballeronis]PXX02854.1 serine O-acetyltransferase [Paraburkholderia caballeronis]RAK03579.1 serine O-acetyltransferase [Paraburkholderia caballeronis]SEC32424.1 serine O-acetyltransferase [Paraburkholderia caballeronis]SEK75191.1 serine O-acetyltransferase [Paraburkholderia caballeronis]
MTVFNVAEIVGALQTVRQQWREEQRRSLEPGGRELPAREALADIVDTLKGVLFPMRLGPPDLRQESENFYVGHALDAALHALLAQARLELQYKARHGRPDDADIDARASAAVHAFAQRLPAIRSLLDSDVLAAFHGDPAAGSVDEVLLCYPGVLAMIHHRLAHELYRLGLPLLARIVAELAHAATGIDIHPGAQIGAGFFIDHGTGVVIGETSVIGERVRVYQAVTLGAKRFPRDAAGHLEKGLARHPIVEDDVVIYAGATILGRVTLGRGAVIGGNVWLTDSVPPGAHVTQAISRHDTRPAPAVAATFATADQPAVEPAAGALR